MKKRLLTSVFALTFAGLQMQAQTTPKLVVTLTIDQLRADYMENFSALYGEKGFKRLLRDGKAYTNATFPFSDIDRSSAIAAIHTGVPPYLNGIIANSWLDITSLRPMESVDDSRFKKRMSFLNKVLELDSFINSPVRTLSLGQRMRADIAASLLHSPKVLFLDEPTIGLDVVVKDNIRKAIAQINEQEHTTVVLTTHDLEDIELLSKRIVMIDKGSKVFDGKITDLKEKYGQMRELAFVTPDENALKVLGYAEKFGLSDDDLIQEQDGTSCKIRFNSAIVPVSDMLSYTLSKINVKDINVKDADIEEIIRRLYKEGVE